MLCLETNNAEMPHHAEVDCGRTLKALETLFMQVWKLLDDELDSEAEVPARNSLREPSSL